MPRPVVLCSSLRSPILLSDGRITTCTKDHTGVNALADIASDDFDMAMEKYSRARTRVSENPKHLPLCNDCYKNIGRWGRTGLPRAGWIKTEFDENDQKKFQSAFNLNAITMNIELASRCNIKCIGCPISEGSKFYATRHAALLDVLHLIDWIGDNARRISRVRLYHIGETFVHPMWVDLCVFLKEKNPRIILMTSTNGMPLAKDKNVRGVLDSRIDEIMFSIHGTTNEVSQKYMGSAFDFDTALDGVRRVAELRSKHGLRLELLWRYLLFAWNDTPEEIGKAKRLAAELGIDELHFTLTGGPSPSQRLRVGSDAWKALRRECEVSSRLAADYQTATPMVALYRPNPSENDKRSGFVPVTEMKDPMGWLPSRAGSKEKAALHVALGRAALEQGRLSDAAAAIEKATQLDAGQPAWVLAVLGRAYSGVQEPGKAARAFQAAIDLANPTDRYTLHLGLARCLRRLRRHQDGVREYRRALSLAPRSSNYAEEIYPELIDALIQAGAGDEARQAEIAWIESVFLVNHEKSIVYCPIPKNACTFFKTALVENSRQAEYFAQSKQTVHVFARSEQAGMRLGEAKFLKDPRYTKFVALRNPYDRLVSAYANLFVEPIKRGHPLEQVVKNVINEVHVAQGLAADWERSITFEEFVAYVERTPDPSLDYHFRPQTALLGRLAFDIVGRVEDMRTTLAQLEAATGLRAVRRRFNDTAYQADSIVDKPHTLRPAELAHLPSLPTPEAMYTDALFEIVTRRYGEDVRFYDQTFATDLASARTKRRSLARREATSAAYA